MRRPSLAPDATIVAVRAPVSRAEVAAIGTLLDQTQRPADLFDGRTSFGLPKRHCDLLLREATLPPLPVLLAPSGAQ